VVRYRLLGPMVIGESALMRLAGRRQARVMAALLLDANQVVSVDRLVDVVWHESPPAQAVKVARNTVSLLRARLSGAGHPATIESAPPGYRLIVPVSEVDFLVFGTHQRKAAALLADGRPDQAAETLLLGLSLWRGRAGEGLNCTALQPVLTRLDEQRLAAWEQYADLEIHNGRYDRLVGPLSELTAAHPLREKLIGQLMLALYAAGRQADALAAYRRADHRLRDELGIAPCLELATLHQQILRADIREPGHPVRF
jgi:DNA-binding SARP family transcriptional activator